MKILFTADMHIKLGQRNVPAEWQTNRFRELFKQLEELSTKHECDLIVNGGDIFDRLPTLEEQQLYYEYISSIKTRTIIYSGNHEATKRGRTFFEYLVKTTRAINPLVLIQIGNYSSEDFDIIPYEGIKEKFPEPTSKLLFTHVRGDIEPHVKAEIALTKFNSWELVLSGDLHSHKNSQRNIVYPGSPLTTSFHRKEVTTGVVIVDTETLIWSFEKLQLPQLLRKKVDTQEEIVPTEYHHTIYEIEGNAETLASVDKNNDLLDKAILDREVSATLNLYDTLTISEELRKYLVEVVKIDNPDEYIRVYNDYT